MKFRLKYRDQELSERETGIVLWTFIFGYAIGGLLTLIVSVVF